MPQTFGFRPDIANARGRVDVSGTEVLRVTATGDTIVGVNLVIDSGGLTVSAGTISFPATALAAAGLAATAGVFTGANMATLADEGVNGGGALLFRITTAGTAGGETIDVVSTHKIRVIGFWTVNAAAGGAADTIQLFNGATAITDALDTNDVDTTISRASTISDASHEIAAGGTLRITEANGAQNQVVDCYVLAVRVA